MCTYCNEEIVLPQLSLYTFKLSYKTPLVQKCVACRGICALHAFSFRSQTLSWEAILFIVNIVNIFRMLDQSVIIPSSNPKLCQYFLFDTLQMQNILQHWNIYKRGK